MYVFVNTTFAYYYLSGDILASHCQRLFANLQAGFWDRPNWKPFKQEVQLLAPNLQKYCELLKVKRQKMLVLHQTTEQIRSVGNSMTVQVTAPRHSPPISVQCLCEAVEEAGIDNPLSLQEVAVLPQVLFS